MKKIITIFLSLLLVLTFVGCKEPAEMPESAIYTEAGAIEILEVGVDETLGSDAVKYIKVKVNFINTSNSELFVSTDNILGYYDETVVQAFVFENDNDYITILSATLEPGITHEGYIWFKIPIDIEIFRLECTTEAGIAIFIYEV